MKTIFIYFIILLLPHILFGLEIDKKYQNVYPMYSKLSYENANVEDSYYGITAYVDFENTNDFRFELVGRIINIYDPFIFSSGFMGKFQINNYFVAADLGIISQIESDFTLDGYGKTITLGYQSNYLGRFIISFSKYNLKLNENRSDIKYHPSDKVEIMSIGWTPLVF